MNKQIGKYTFRLFDRPTFLDGFTSLVDFRKQMRKYHTDKTEMLADMNSLESDWRAVGFDIKTAMRTYERTTEEGEPAK